MSAVANKPGSTMRHARLDQTARVVGGATPKTGEASFWGGPIAWATPKDLSTLDGSLLGKTARTITHEGLGSCAAEVLPAGSVLFSSRAPIGLTAINTVPMATNQGFKSLVPEPGVSDAGYLYHWLRANRPYLESLGNGATFKEVSKAVVSRVEIPLPHKNGKPDMDEQKRIAAILDKADGIRRKRKQALRLTDDFLRSVFLDMFGDPVTNPKGWNEDELKSLGKVITGSTPPSKKEGMFDGDIPFVTPGDLTGGHVSSRRTVTAEGAKNSRIVRPGATFVCCIGATIGKMGKAAIRSAFNQQINAVEWDDRVSGDYGLEALKFFKATIASRGSSTTLPILNKSAFQCLKIPLPPRTLQDQFSATIKSQHCLRQKQEAAATAEDNLFASLQQRAFRGEL
jgi:type I restriction enzyme S subunit